MKFKRGDKVKLPTKKTTWGSLESSNHYKKAVANGQDHMFVIGYDEDGYYEVSENSEDLGADFFMESDLELYVENMFKVGDKVKIKRASSNWTGDGKDCPKTSGYICHLMTGEFKYQVFENANSTKYVGLFNDAELTLDKEEVLTKKYKATVNIPNGPLKGDVVEENSIFEPAKFPEFFKEIKEEFKVGV